MIGEAIVDEMNAAVASKLAVNSVECMVYLSSKNE